MEQLTKNQLNPSDNGQMRKEFFDIDERKANEQRIIFLESHGMIKKTKFRPPVKHSENGGSKEIKTRGDFVESFPLQLPYDGNDDTNAKHGLRLDGEDTPFFTHTTGIDPQTGECNLSVTSGQFFDIVHQNSTSPTADSLYGTSMVSGQRKFVITPRRYEEEVFITAHVNVKVPMNREEVYYIDRGNLNLDLCMVEARMRAALKISDNYQSEDYEFLHAVRSSVRPDMDKFEYNFDFETTAILPRRMIKFEFLLLLIGGAYTSKDFTQVGDLSNDKFGFALLDLRNKRDRGRYRIMRDPLGAWEKQPFGGAIPTVTFHVHKVENTEVI
ncbi:MAG: hypothetical protein ACXWV0_07790 [Flavisolibacter sp.]